MTVKSKNKKTNTKNITEKKKKEIKIKEEKDKFQVLFEGSKNAIFIADPKTKKIIDCNSTASEMTGYSKKKLLGLKAPDLHPAELRKEQKKIFNKQLKGELDVAESKLLTKKGEKVPVLITAVSINLKGKKRLMGSFQDITEIKEKEKQVEKEKQKFKEIFNNINDALYLHAITKKGMPSKFLEVNKLACKMLGYGREEFIKMSPADIDSEENKEKIPQVMKDLSSKGVSKFEGYHIAKNGKKIPVEINSHLFEIEGEKRVVSAVRDITDRKEVEKKSTEIQKKLEEKLEEMERINKIMMGRELKMIELKTKIAELEEQNKLLNK